MPYSLRRSSLRKIARLLDLTIVGAAFLAAMIISSKSFTWFSLEQLLSARVKIVNLVLIVGYMVFCSLIFSLHGFYSRRGAHAWSQRVAKIFMGMTVIAAVWLLFRPLADFAFATNSFLFVFWLFGCSALTLIHETVRSLQHAGRLQGRSFRNVVIIGDEPHARTLAARIQQQPTLGYRLLRIISTKETEV